MSFASKVHLCGETHFKKGDSYMMLYYRMSSRRWFHPNIHGVEAEVLLLEHGTGNSFILLVTLASNDFLFVFYALIFGRLEEVQNVEIVR